jgi:enoyl-CoA hydratase/carnithine racemase
MALEIALTGTPRTAVEYRALGLVNRVCEPGALHSATREFAAVFNDRAPWAVRRTKALMRACEEAPIATGIELANQLNQLLRLDNALSQAESAPQAGNAA